MSPDLCPAGRVGESSSSYPLASASRKATGLVRGEGRDAGTVAFEQAVVAFFIDAADLLGVPKSVAAIYGICFASPAPLTFADIDARLDISRGSISQGLRVLCEVGALKKVGDAADRREHFAPDLALRKLADHWIEERLTKQLTSGRQRLQTIAKSLPPDANGGGKVLRARLKTLQTWHDKTRAVLPIVKTFLKLT